MIDDQRRAHEKGAARYAERKSSDGTGKANLHPSYGKFEKFGTLGSGMAWLSDKGEKVHHATFSLGQPGETHRITEGNNIKMYNGDKAGAIAFLRKRYGIKDAE